MKAINWIMLTFLGFFFAGVILAYQSSILPISMDDSDIKEILFLSICLILCGIAIGWWGAYTPRKKEINVKDLTEGEIVTIHGFSFLYTKGENCGRVICYRSLTKENIILLIEDGDFANKHTLQVDKESCFVKKGGKLCYFQKHKPQ